MEFAYDPKKSAANKAKHGIDFETAQELWKDPYVKTINARSHEETRQAIIATYQGKQWFACYTLREERIRLISVRRAREGETRLYFGSRV